MRDACGVLAVVPPRAACHRPRPRRRSLAAPRSGSRAIGPRRPAGAARSRATQSSTARRGSALCRIRSLGNHTRLAAPVCGAIQLLSRCALWNPFMIFANTCAEQSLGCAQTVPLPPHCEALRKEGAPEGLDRAPSPPARPRTRRPAPRLRATAPIHAFCPKGSQTEHVARRSGQRGEVR